MPLIDELLLKMQIREAGRADAPALMIDPFSGKLLGSWELSERMEKTYGQPVIAVLWRHLLNILSEHLPEECKHYGHQCLDVTQVEISSYPLLLTATLLTSDPSSSYFPFLYIIEAQMVVYLTAGFMEYIGRRRSHCALHAR